MINLVDVICDFGNSFPITYGHGVSAIKKFRQLWNSLEKGGGGGGCLACEHMLSEIVKTKRSKKGSKKNRTASSQLGLS